jgi:Terminase large subunit, T4likevirus-type, N-terminal
MDVELRLPQCEVFRSDRRFRVLVAGRRFGKTYLALVELCRAAWGSGRTVWYVAPTYKQAKRVAWRALKEMTREFWAEKPNETDLSIRLRAGGTIALRGADNYDSLRGEGLDFVVLDEYASMAPEAWTEVLRPSLSDRQGKALFIGTPRGYNHFYELFERAQGQSGWAAFKFTTEEGGNVPAGELASAARELDERTYRQEYQASFENVGSGIVYYGFDRSGNVEIVEYDPKQPLCWSLDFNMNPMCSVLAQKLPDGTVHVLEEMSLANANTEAACEYFLRRTSAWVRPFFPMNVYVYGDATGSGRSTSASRTDWQIVKAFFRRHPDEYQAQVRVPNANPAVKDRANCVNAMLCNHAGTRRAVIHPRCKELIKDLEQVRWKSDPHGNPLPEVDKSDPLRTHLSDALGYFLVYACPIRPRVLHGSTPLL